MLMGLAGVLGLVTLKRAWMMSPLVEQGLGGLFLNRQEGTVKEETICEKSGAGKGSLLCSDQYQCLTHNIYKVLLKCLLGKTDFSMIKILLNSLFNVSTGFLFHT